MSDTPNAPAQEEVRSPSIRLMKELIACLESLSSARASDIGVTSHQTGMMDQTYQAPSLESPFEIRPPYTAERPEGSGTYVRIYDDVRACIVYLGLPEPDDEAGFSPAGTGFVVASGREGHGDYIVTAAHVAKALDGAPFAVRLNSMNGKARVDRVESARWWYHPDDKVDVALFCYQPPEWAKTSPWIPKWFVSDHKRETKNIGAGDLAYIVGLYRPMPGTISNTPFVHTGHIASMADGEKVDARDWRAADPDKALIGIEGYIVEAQTLDGLSGAPVFVRRSIQTKVHVPEVDKNPLRVWWHGSLWLLGIWHGAWYGEPTKQKLPLRGAIKVPVGMGIVTPAKKMIELLETPALKRLREESAMKARRDVAPDLSRTDDAAKRRDEMLRAMLSQPASPRKRPARKRVSGK